MKKSKELELSNSQMQKSIEEKTQQYAAIEDKIASFEEALGLEAENNLTISARLDNLQLTNEQQLGILGQIPNGWPIENKGITGNFGWREHPLLKRREFHPGIDLRAEIGTPIYAPASGVVEFSGYSDNGYGYNVILLHNFGFKTVFAHMMRKEVVKAGQFVNKGQLIGYSGNTGLSTGPHLPTIRNYIFYNYLFELPFVDKSLFVKDAKKIVPSLKASDIYYAKGFGGVRPQVIDKTKGELMLGEASITETPGIIFNMTPSPGATSCLGNAERDAKLVCNYLGMEFNEDKFSSELL